MPHNPPLTLALGPAHSGKTTWTLDRFCEHAGQTLLVVPSQPQADTLAVRLAERTGKPREAFAASVLPFHSLVREIQRAVPESNTRRISRTMQRFVVADLLRSTIRPDDYFGKMLEAPGFVAALVERIREWKLAGIAPDALEDGGQAASERLGDPAFALKTRELARLFRAYETFLRRNHLCDEEDALHFATQTLSESRNPLPAEVSLLIVDGFYRFTRSQRQLLFSCAARGLEVGRPEIKVAVTLPHDDARPLLFAAPERTRRTFQAEFAVQEIRFNAVPSSQPAALNLLSARLFQTGEGKGHEEGIEKNKEEKLASDRLDTINAESCTSSIPPSFPLPSPFISSLSPVQLLDAPNPYVEAEMAAREFRRLHESYGFAWQDFAIVLRTLGDYAPILSAVFERYAIPLGVDGPEVLAENPLLKTVLYLLAVVRRGWQREDVLAFLKSSYTAPTKLEADGLRRRAKSRSLRQGRNGWLELAETEPGEASNVLRDMAQCDALLTGERAQPEEFANRIRAIIRDFGLEERIERGEPIRAARDRAALEAGLETLDALAQMERLAGRETLTFAAFHDALLSAWQQGSSIAPTTTDVVRVVEPFDTRERPIRVAAVMGLTERVFPRRVTEDPFLRDDERLALREAAGIELDLQQSRTDDERLFFYLAVTAPEERLLLSYPRAANESDTLPSFYLDEVRAALKEKEPRSRGAEEKHAATEDNGTARTESSPSLLLSFSPRLLTVSRTLADVAPQPDEAVSDGDRILAVCAEMFDPSAQGDVIRRVQRRQEAVRMLQSALAGENQSHTLHRVVESRFLPSLPRLENLDLRFDFANAKTAFSVSELESYNRCPLQYLLRHVLKLRPEEDGVNVRTQGTILHTVLRRYYRKEGNEGEIKREGKGIEETRNERQETGEHTEQHTSFPSVPLHSPSISLSEGLRDLLAETLQSENLDATPHRIRMTHRMLSDALDGFAQRESRFGPQFGFAPTHFELAFGAGEAGAALLEDDERDDMEWEMQDGRSHGQMDACSLPEPLLLYPHDGGAPVRVCGIIDRVDFDATGQRALVLDYKLGLPPDFSEIQRGQSLQMPLYLLAMERLWGKIGAVGCYDAMRERGRRRFHRAEHVTMRQFAPLLPLDDGATVKPLNRDQYADLTRTAEAAAIRAARAIGEARIEATPGDHCRVCPYADICRTTQAEGHDGETAVP